MVGQIEDLRRAPVVRLQPVDLRLRVSPGEIEDVAEVGPPEGVDRLGVVAHDGHVPVYQAHEIDDLRLDPVRVLVLVNEDVGKDGGIVFPQGLVLSEHGVPVEEEVVEIHGSSTPFSSPRTSS